VAYEFFVTNGHTVAFGLGASEVVDRIRILWPSGLEQSLYHVTANQRPILCEGIFQFFLPLLMIYFGE